MNTFQLEGWRRDAGARVSIPIESMRFHIDERCHLRLEAAEERLQRYQEPELLIEVDMGSLELETSSDCGPLADCHVRVYLDNDDRGQFHLVGHRASDHSLVYSNAVMVDLLG